MGVLDIVDVLRRTGKRKIVAKKNVNGTYSGIELVDHNDIGENNRWLRTYSHKEEYNTSELAIAAFKAYLEAIDIERRNDACIQTS